jgi:hypothetical protein
VVEAETANIARSPVNMRWWRHGATFAEGVSGENGGDIVIIGGEGWRAHVIRDNKLC